MVTKKGEQKRETARPRILVTIAKLFRFIGYAALGLGLAAVIGMIISLGVFLWQSATGQISPSTASFVPADDFGRPSVWSIYIGLSGPSMVVSLVIFFSGLGLLALVILESLPMKWAKKLVIWLSNKSGWPIAEVEFGGLVAVWAVAMGGIWAIWPDFLAQWWWVGADISVVGVLAFGITRLLAGNRLDPSTSRWPKKLKYDKSAEKITKKTRDITDTRDELLRRERMDDESDEPPTEPSSEQK